MYQEYGVDVRSLAIRPDIESYAKQMGHLPLSETRGAEREKCAHLIDRAQEMEQWVAARFGVDISDRIVNEDKIYLLKYNDFDNLVKNLYDREGPTDHAQLQASYLSSGHIIIRKLGILRERVLLDHERFHGVSNMGNEFFLFQEGLVRLLTTAFMDDMPERETYLRGVAEDDRNYCKAFTELFEIMHRKSRGKLEVDFPEFIERIYEGYLSNNLDVGALISDTLGEGLVDTVWMLRDLNDLEIFMQNFR